MPVPFMGFGNGILNPLPKSMAPGTKRFHYANLIHLDQEFKANCSCVTARPWELWRNRGARKEGLINLFSFIHKNRKDQRDEKVLGGD